ncbi:hypothetical protein MY9_0552 [Bacillus sp. JS]|nr:hypothetical protein MY9_0552 [Bacillus sp. JS]
MVSFFGFCIRVIKSLYIDDVEAMACSSSYPLLLTSTIWHI